MRTTAAQAGIENHPLPPAMTHSLSHPRFGAGDSILTGTPALRAAAADLEHAAIVSLNNPVAALNDVRPAAHTVHDAAAALLTADDLFSEHAARLSEEG